MRLWLGATAVALVAVLAPPGAARAEDPPPFTRSASSTYQVTFAARACASYDDVMANQVRDDNAESPGRPGGDSPYKPGQPVDPDTEARAGCEPLAGAQFTLGTGRQKIGALSTVTGAAEPVTTTASAPRLDPAGRAAGSPIAGAVTVALTGDQVRQAARRGLWAQGGTPQAPLPSGHSFGVLRCAVDGRTGGNTQWITFPGGARHVFCYGYYVRGAAGTATFTVKLRTTRPAGYPQRIPFESTVSQGGGFVLTGDTEERTFVRLSGEAHRVLPRLPSGWRLADVTCAGSEVTTDVATGRTELKLAAGETATCAYAVEPPVAPAGLTLRAYAEGGAATVGLTVTGDGAATHTMQVAPRGDGSAATATGANLSALPAGAYTVRVTPPGTGAEAWSLAGAACNGSPVAVKDWELKITVAAAAPSDCVLRLARRQGAVTLRVVTDDGVAAAAFAVVPADTSGPGWSAAATTSSPGKPSNAAGDVPASVPFGSYQLIPVPPVVTADSAWRLSALGCQPGNSAGADAEAVRLDLSAGAASAECTATYRRVPTTRLHLTARAEGSATHGSAAVKVECADGSTAATVLPANDLGPAELPEPLVFAEESTCTVSLAETADRPRNASVLVESAPGNAPLAVPATVALGTPGSDVRLAVVLSYDGPPVGEVSRGTKALNSFSVMPLVLIGSGLVGIGAATLLVVVARRRMGMD